MTSVSCASTTSCVGVGSDVPDVTGPKVGLIYTLSGGSWTMQVAPLPPGATGNETPSSVSCADSADCLAVGVLGSDTGGNLYAPLALTLASGTWTAAISPVPADVATSKDAQLATVSCPVVSYCVAGGIYTKSTNVTVPLFDLFDSGTITASEGPAPHHSLVRKKAAALILDVSCYAPSACTAIGEFVGGSMILTLASDGTWRAQATTRARRSPFLDGLSCVSSTFCRAVGVEGTEKAIFESKG